METVSRRSEIVSFPPLSHCAAALVMLAAAVGCDRPAGPDESRTTRLSGHVRFHGRPVPKGWVEIMPIEGTIGHLRSGRIGPDGGFVADRVPVGRVAIRFVGMPVLRAGNPAIDAMLAQFRQVYLIHRTVGPAPNAPLELDLEIEAIEAESRWRH